MRKSFPLIVSFFSGIAVTVIVALSVGAGAVAPQTEAPIGRFKMKMTENRAYIFDTATGMVWENLSNAATNDQGFKANKLAPAK
jgi:hypothetical protein